MSHSDSPVSVDDVQQIVEAEPLRVSNTAKTVLWSFFAIGVGAFVVGLLSTDPSTAKATWVSLQVNFTYWFMLAAASTCFAAVFHICNAQWARPIRRIFEASSQFFTFSVIPLFVLIFGHTSIFKWATEEHTGKEFWLNPGFFYTRDIFAVLLLIWLGRRLVFLSVSKDIGAIRGGLTGAKDIERWKSKMYDKYVEDWSKDTKSELGRIESSMGMLSPVVVILYSLIMSLVAFDQIMSVDYHWYSTLFGVLFFMSGVYATMAFASMGVYFFRQLHPLFRVKVERRTLHDLGKLLFGFGIFWAYMFWSHYLPIWYGNIPEETGWIITRLREMPWQPFAWMVLTACFFVPFLLGLSRDVKQVPILLFATGSIVACGLWCQQYLLIAPTIFPTTIPLSLIDLGITLGFLGAYVLSCLRFLEQMPLMPFGDFYAKR